MRIWGALSTPEWHGDKLEGKEESSFQGLLGADDLGVPAESGARAGLRDHWPPAATTQAGPRAPFGLTLVLPALGCPLTL